MTTRKPRYIAVQCAWCREEHWLVKRNILTSRALPTIASFISQAEAEAEAKRLSEQEETRG